MLYIFLVDPGIMVNFEMTYIVESVANLKKAIEERCHIPVSEQILLISGGERLEDNQRVGKYHTGTDSNPIFLFRDVSNSPPTSVVDVNEYMPDLSESVNSVLDLQPSIHTVTLRSTLAQKLCMSAQEQLRIAEGLVHDQHLQQQGWAAVLAHLDDMIIYYTSVCSACEKTYAQFLEIRDTFVELLNSFNEDLNRISKLPVLPALLSSGEQDIEPVDSGLSLLDWITSHKDGDSDQTLAEVAVFCARSIQILDQKLMTKVSELREYIKIAESNYRDVKVIETKLEHLEQVMYASKRIVQDQISQAQTFNSNLTSAIKERDASILKELCNFHREWLLVMESNRTQLCNNLRTCAAYKSELCAYLQTRLQWVRKMFSDMRDTNEFVFLYYESIKKLRTHYDFLQSLRSTPSMYVCAVTEVVRRRAFSQAYLTWANDLSCQLLAITSEEVSRRKRFQEQFEGHFLDKLFPGLEDVPPTYATQAPESFDDNLPRLTYEDVEVLKQYLPELELSISIPEPAFFSHLFFFRCVSDTLTLPQPPAASVEDRIVQVVAAAGLASNLDTTLLRAADFLPNALCSDKGCDSEGTDTEEFEKLRHSGQTVSSCSESNETVKMNIRQLGLDASGKLVDMREELASLKSEMLENKKLLLEEFQSSIGEVTRVLKERERTILHLTQILGMKESELCTLRSQVISMENNLKSSIEREEQERMKREEFERRSKEERQKEMKELTETLNRQHRLELESVRSRYKMITCSNMERSPSDTSLERIETNHEAMLSQMRENFELEKENLLAEERRKWSEKLEQDLNQYKMKMEAEKQVWLNESMRQTLAEHTHQLESYRKREEALLSDVQKFESRLRQSSTEDLLRRIETLEREKVELELEMRVPSYSAHSEALSTSSVSVCESSSSPLQRRGADLLRSRVISTAGSTSSGGIKLSTTTCRPGDIVLILWNDRRGYFYVFSASDQMYLLHPECIPVAQNEVLLKKYGFIAEVLSSEYCRAKKENNRYKVPVDCKFYRIDVGPISNQTLLRYRTQSES